MTEAAPENTTPDAAEPKGGDTPQPKSISDLLAENNMPQEAASFILDEIKKARTEAKNLRDRVHKAEPLAKAAMDEAEAKKSAEQRALDAAEAATKRAELATARAIRSDVRAMAAELSFADPDDASAFLDLASYVDPLDGEVNTDAISNDLSALLVRKPHLAKNAPGERRAPAPDHSQASGATNPAAGDPAAQFASFLNAQLRG